MLEFRILGSLEVSAGGVSLPVSGRNPRSVLTFLLLRANEPVSAERLITEIWGEHPPPAAKAALQNAVSQLRKTLGPDVLLRRPTGYMLSVEAERIDLRRFERLT